MTLCWLGANLFVTKSIITTGYSNRGFKTVFDNMHGRIVPVNSR